LISLRCLFTRSAVYLLLFVDSPLLFLLIGVVVHARYAFVYVTLRCRCFYVAVGVRYTVVARWCSFMPVYRSVLFRCYIVSLIRLPYLVRLCRVPCWVTVALIWFVWLPWLRLVPLPFVYGVPPFELLLRHTFAVATVVRWITFTGCVTFCRYWYVTFTLIYARFVAGPRCGFTLPPRSFDSCCVPSFDCYLFWFAFFLAFVALVVITVHSVLPVHFAFVVDRCSLFVRYVVRCSHYLLLLPLLRLFLLFAVVAVCIAGVALSLLAQTLPRYVADVVRWCVVALQLLLVVLRSVTLLPRSRSCVDRCVTLVCSR